MNRRRSIAACIGLAGVASPWAALLVVAWADFDPAHHHSRPAHRPAEAVDIALHGHQHEPGTPPHDHALMIAKAARLSSRMTPVVAVAWPLPSPAEASAATLDGARFVTGPTTSPPVSPPNRPILRI